MADFTVTTLDDENDAGATVGSPGGAGLSLREALTLANGAAGADNITFAAGLAGGTLFLAAGAGDLDISSDVAIDGDVNGDGTADIQISADSADGLDDATSRVFNIGAAGTISATLNGLVIRDGKPGPSTEGGGILVDGGDTLTLSNSTISGNSAYHGGGILSRGTLTVVNSTFEGNNAGSSGGAILNVGGMLALTNVTVSNNSGPFGGGIWNGFSTGPAALTNVTISGNSAATYGGGIRNNSADLTLINTIVAGNEAVYSGDEISDVGTLTLTGGNIIGDTFSIDGVAQQTGIALTDIFASVTAAPNTGVNSGTLADNGGAVETIALNPDLANPALGSADPDGLDETAAGIDLNGDGDTNDIITTDARGFTREVGAGIDLGAFETGALAVTTLDDELDAADTNLATADLNDLSLREALAIANSDPDANAITFDAALTGGTLTLTLGQLTISSDVTIDGDVDSDDKADITISGNDAFRIFNITGAATDVDLKSLTLTDGNSGGTEGGAIFASSVSSVDIVDTTIRNSNASFGGGASFNNTTTTLTNSLIVGNDAIANGGGLSANQGSLTLTNTTVHGNTADSSGGGIEAFNATLQLHSSTVTGNRADADGGNADQGGGIADQESPTISIINSVVAENTSGTSNTADDVKGTIDDATNSFFGTSETITGTNTGNIIGGGDPGLAALADNGGTVQTRALETGSPLIDAGSVAALPLDTQDIDDDGDLGEVLPTDARGFDRAVDLNPGGGTLDIGAFEQQAGASFVVTTLEDELDSLDPNATLLDFGGAADLSLREALALAEQDPTSFDAITFDDDLIGGVNPGVDDGMLVLSQGELAVFGNVSIDGDVNGDDAFDITVDGAGASSVFHVYSGTATLNGLHITGGNSSYGGGVAVGSYYFGTTADVTISNSTISNNVAGYGGGISVDPGSSLQLTNSTVSGNEAYYSGGGIANAGTLTVTNSIVSGNEANLAGPFYSGGGIYNVGTATLIGSTISDNNGGFAGGGIYNTDELTLVNTTVSENYALNGGGIANVPGCGCGSSTVALYNSTLVGNGAANGGGIINAEGTLSLTNTTLYGNFASYSNGGGIFSLGGTLSVTSSTLSGNFAAYDGGGIASSDVAATLTNSIVAGNSANGIVSDVAIYGAVTYSGVNVFSQAGAGDGDDIVEPDLANIFATLTTIDPDGTPTNGDEFQAGALADNGGTVETILILAGGAAHNAGENAALPADDLQDLDGDTVTSETLPVDARGPGFTRVRSTTVDIGAVELENTAPLVAIPILDQSSPANAFWSFQVPAGSLDDPDNDPLTFSATLANGDPLPDWLTFNALTQTFTGTPPRGFVGPIELTVTADDGTASISDDFLLTVTASNPGPVNLTPNPDTYNAGNTGETINGLGSNDTITGGLGNDFINGNDGNDIIDGGGFSNVLHGDGGNDYVASTGNLNEGWGDDGADQLFFIGNQNQLFGGEGNDWHGVSGTNNALAANGGDDWLGATGNFNTLNGQDGNDFLTTTGIGNVLHGETGNDWLGVSGNLNQLFGGAGNDWLGATGDNNTLDGGAGNDTLVAAPGTHQGDVFNYRPGYAQDEIIGFSRHNAGGTDVVSIQGFGVTTFGQLQTFMTQSGGDTVITLNTADILLLRGVAPGTLQASDFLLA